MNSSTPIELRNLNNFVALAEELNFQKAAKRLHITGPALSVQIQKLEDLLCVRLCERSSFRKMRLTVAGTRLLSEARDLLRNTQRLVNNVRNAASEDKDSLRIGLTSLFNQSFIMQAIKSYCLLNPAEKVQWVEVGMEHNLLDALESGQIHMGFAYDFHLPRMKKVDHLLIVDSPVRAVMGAGNPLATLKQVPLSTLARQTLLCFQDSWFDFQDFSALFQEKHLSLQNIKRTHCDVCVVDAIGGMTLMSEMQASVLCPRLVSRPIEGLNPSFRVRICAVWEKHKKSQQILDFLHLLQENAAQ